MTQGERIKELRKYLDLTMEKFGERLGVGKTAISKLENNERNLTDQMAISICREFNVNETWLRTGEGEMFEPMSRGETIAQFAGESSPCLLFHIHDSLHNRCMAIVLHLRQESNWETYQFFGRKSEQHLLSVSVSAFITALQVLQETARTKSLPVGQCLLLRFLPAPCQ